MLRYWIFGILTLLLSLCIFIFKGYFDISSINAQDPPIVTYLENTSVKNTPFFLVNTAALEKELQQKFTWLKEPKISVSPRLVMKVTYEYRQPALISDKDNIYVSSEGVLFENENLEQEITDQVPKFIVGAEEIGTKVIREEELSYIKALNLYPKLIVSKSDEKIFIKPEEYSWYLELVALMESEENAKSTNNLINSLLESNDGFSSVVILGDRLVVKD